MQYEQIGIFIKNKRMALKQTLNGFALKNDIEPAILCRIENQKQDIKLGILIKIAKGFRLTPSEFLREFENDCNKQVHLQKSCSEQC